ncbi:unnamed protein product [Rotaria sp. Silwood2]|nr:unnamed protein product [Rotaria sp. Silwood2]
MINIIILIVASIFFLLFPAISYNQPNLCPNATWNSTAITFATTTTVGSYPQGIFVDTKNTVYVAHRTNHQVLVWLNGSTTPTGNISGGLNYPYSVFVTDIGDIYVDNGYSNEQVDKWTSNSTISVPAMYMCGQCYGLFVDITNTLYCSVFSYHQVISNSQRQGSNTWTIVAGNGVAALSSTSLYNPRGIFVDKNLNLYVADSENDRIQFFPPGQLIGTTLAGTGASGTIALLYPTAVVLDADGYLFIVDCYYHRIIGQGPNGFRCIAACSGAGSTSSQLYYPLTLSFDTYGNIFVTDQDNHRIQKFLLSTNSCTISYNQPKFSAYASWSGNAITFATIGTVGAAPYGIFVDINNTVYVANRASSLIQVWSEGSNIPTRNITSGLAYPYSVFVKNNGDIYVDNGYSNNRVDKWILNLSTSSSVMYVKQACYSLFIDINNNLYCSMYDAHQVVTKSLNSNSSMWIVAAGESCAGSTYNKLYYPRGIFVDTNLNLYVADCGNNRVQLFPSGQVTATTVAGSAAIGTISLYCPSGVVLDGDGYLFIVDSYNHRIVASGPTGFRCIVGCSTVAGSSSSQLIYPSLLSFDSYGNIFVTDRDNSRIQKFILIPNTTYPFSFNQPNFCPSTTWYLDGITFANSSMVGLEPYGLFVSINNTVYVADRQNGRIIVWLEGSLYPDKIISGAASFPLSLFATLSDDIYIDNGVSYSRIDKWPRNSNSSVITMTIVEECYSIFVDISNTIYCAMTFYHQIAKKWLNNNGTTLTVAAGTGAAGGASNQLYYPAGIFVDVNFNLYVGDCGNDRVQMFSLGQVNGIAIAGAGAPGTITLDCPHAITFDANGYLFIVDHYNHRIVGSGPYGFRCLFGCTTIPGSAPSQLYYPRTFGFDSYGNLFVAEQYNHRIHKFILASNSCSLSYNQPKFCPDALWYSNASTFASNTTIGSLPYGIFIDGINNVYVPSKLYRTVLVWSQWSNTPTGNISIYLNRTFSLFVSITGDIYVDNGYSNGRVDKFIFNTSNIVTVMNINGSCYSLFLDIKNYLYCSLKDFHQVVKILLNNGTNMPTIAAGNGSAGSASNMLDSQQGIYVDSNLNLYIADCGNDRIQRFQFGQLNGVTLAGSGASGTITLDCPTDIVLDNDGYLFIVDSNNHRIVASSSYGFRCLIGCSGGGSSSSQLSYPQSMAFDSYGNMFVTDRNNSRVQQFIFNNSPCTVQTTIQSTVVLTTNAVQTTITLATTTIGTTSALTTAAIKSTMAPAVSTVDTTVVSITAAAGTTETPTTSILAVAQTSITSHIESTAVSTTSTPIITNPPATSTVETTETPMTSVPTTSEVPTTSTIETTEAPTTSAPITSEAPTTSTIETTAALTTSVFITTETSATSTVETTEAPMTSVPTTSDAPTTSTIETTEAPMTSAPITSEAPTTSTIETTEAPTTSAPITSEAPTTSTIETTEAPMTSVPTTTEIPATSTIETTESPMTSDVKTTDTLTTSAPDTTTVPTTTTIKTSAAAITSAVLSTVDATTTLFAIGLLHQIFFLKAYIGIFTVIDRITTNIIETTDVKSSTQLEKEEISSTQQQSSIITISTTSESLITNESCFSPTVTLIPGKSSLTSPLQYRRSQDFSIISIIQLNCQGSLSTIITWSIKNCSSSCSFQIQLSEKVITTLSELYIPSRSLAYGIYEFKIIVAQVDLSSLISTASAYVRITPSGITANLVQLGTSMITRGSEQDLLLDPGTFSIDPDEDSFDASKWKYEYYCRIYGLYNFPNLRGILLSIDDNRTDPSNPSCLSNRSNNGRAWQYTNSTISPKSSITILSGSLQSNRTYQFLVYMENRRNSSIQATGYLLVKVEDTRPQLIAVGCVISTMCLPNLEFQLVNPTTQVALFSICVGSCTNIQNITWNIYQGSDNSSSNNTRWILFNQMISYENIWFFGRNTTNFTATNKLFLENPQITLWRFEVVYALTTETSTSALNFAINQPPYNGSCSMNPLNGTTSTLFTISCSDWFDEDGIKDYSLYVWTKDSSERLIIAFSPVSIFQVRLPAGDDQTSILNIVIYIRDILDCLTEMNMSSVSIVPDSTSITDLINNLQSSSNEIENNPIVQLLASGNQNIVGQIITSISQQFNKMNNESLDNAASNGVPLASISVASLGSTRSQEIFIPLNESALTEYNKELNSQANVRDYLITFTNKLAITTSNSIKLQSTSLAQLTQATNQLTRSSSLLASNKCHQLSLALHSMATKISYEDVQAASTQLIQCGTNVLTAINGAIQQRTSLLNLDLSRSNELPIDYETDLESEWSNLNLFADGNDFSMETIEKNRNIYYQKQAANQIENQVKEMMELLTSSLNIHLNLGQNLLINTSETFMSLETISVESLSNRIVKQVGNAQFRIPSNLTFDKIDNFSISLRSMMNPLAPFGNSKSGLNQNLSRSISLSILDHNENEISIRTNLIEPIQLIIPRDPNLIIPSMILQNVTSTNNTPHNQLFYLNYINITNNLTVSIHFEVYPLNINLAYLFIYKFDETPLLNSSINLIDGWTLFCPSDLTNENIYKYFINNQQTSGHQSLIFGLRELSSIEMIEFCLNSSYINLPITDERYNFTSNYELRIYTSGCYYLDSNNNWKSDGLIVGSLTNHYETECLATHLTTFAGGFIVLPSPINWSYVFSNADFMRNKTIYLTVISFSIIYIILMIYARFKDKKDIEKLGVTPLSDNIKSDQYFYEILVFTGRRVNAGTKSKVRFILSGANDETNVRTFSDSHRKIFQRGGIDAFIMAVPKSLGLLNYIRIWHDNTGQGSLASWFLKYIIVRDLQTMENFHFISQQWFAVEKDDGLIERILPVANEIEKHQFSYVLSKKAYHSISDSHLWFSIFSRPPSNKFTRVQRCTCCFVLLFISMLLNIMYYDLSTEAKSSNKTEGSSLSIGPLHITPEQIGIGIMVELLSLIPSLLIVQFFRRIRTRQQISPIYETLYSIKPLVQVSRNVNAIKNKRIIIRFPWWCLFIAYTVSFLMIAVSILFIIARGIEFGDLKTQKWLTSILTGFFSSILLTQPIKIVCSAIFFACFLRNSNEDEETNEYIDDNRIDLNNNEDYLHSIEYDSLCNSQSGKLMNRLNKNELANARQYRLKEIRMWSIIREFFIYLTFLTLICIIAYSNCEYNSFLQVHHLRKYFFNSKQISYDYTEISTIDECWNWLENSFVSNLRAQQWYNGETPRNMNGYINDKSNRIIGWSTMRQLRIKSNLCSDQRIISICNNDYSLFNEEKHSFQPGWINQTSTELEYSSSILKAFKYTTSDKLDTYIYIGQYETYSGGGYIYEFRGRLSDLKSNLSKLHQLGWIDDKTRAIFIQLTLYNPNVQLFTSVTFLVEFLSTGSISPTARFEPLNFYVFTSVLQLACTICYMFFIIYFMIIEIRLLFKLKLNYFRQFRSLIELGIIICSLGSVVVYIWRFQEFKRISRLFKETNGYVYINLQLAVYVNDLLTFFLGFCCFFGTIKFVHLFRFNQRISLFTETLRYAGKELVSFSMMFAIVFMSFLSLFYLLFVSKIWSCSSLLSSAQMLFEMTLMKFDASELIGADAIIGPLCFSTFILLVVFVCLSMFISIINDSFRCARENQVEDQDILSFMLNKLLNWIRMKALSRSQITEKQDSRMRAQYFHPIENFPDRIDQLLEAISRLYISQQADLLRLEKAGV